MTLTNAQRADDLHGRLFSAHLAPSVHKNRSEHFIARIERIVLSRRGVCRALIVKRYNATTDKWNGTKIKLAPPEFEGLGCGVIYRHKIIPLAEWFKRPLKNVFPKSAKPLDSPCPSG